MSPEPTNSRHSPFLIGSAVFAFLWVVARACVQSITIDEADTFLAYAVPPNPSAWEAMSNNHVLNSLLMRLLVYIFGASPFTIRLPALIGAAVYIVAVYILVGAVSRRVLVQWSLFTCMVFSPFVMDYLVAGRGYSMAIGFLMAAMALACRRPAPLHWMATWISVCAALSFCANFSFAVVDAAMVVLLFLWIGRKPEGGYPKTVAAFALPGVAVAYFFVGSVVLGWPKGQFTYGSNSLVRTSLSMIAACLYEPSQYLLHPPLHHYFVHYGKWLVPLLAAFILWRVGALAEERSGLHGTPAALAGIAAAALALTLAVHQFLYWVWGILLPLERTGLYIAPLFFLMVGAGAVITTESRLGRASGHAITAILVLLACYSIACLRLTYFREWKYDSDTRKIYGALAYYNRTYGVRDVSANWRYVAALNAYREISGHETLNQIGSAPQEVNQYPPGFPIYVVFFASDYEFLKREGLKLVYHDEFSGAAVAVRPEVETATGTLR